LAFSIWRRSADISWLPPAQPAAQAVAVGVPDAQRPQALELAAEAAAGPAEAAVVAPAALSAEPDAAGVVAAVVARRGVGAPIALPEEQASEALLRASVVAAA
jgi:hypothetical protein